MENREERPFNVPVAHLRRNMIYASIFCSSSTLQFLEKKKPGKFALKSAFFSTKVHLPTFLGFAIDKLLKKCSKRRNKPGALFFQPSVARGDDNIVPILGQLIQEDS